jgi:hypothetical protein
MRPGGSSTCTGESKITPDSTNCNWIFQASFDLTLSNEQLAHPAIRRTQHPTQSPNVLVGRIIIINCGISHGDHILWGGGLGHENTDCAIGYFSHTILDTTKCIGMRVVEFGMSLIVLNHCVSIYLACGAGTYGVGNSECASE